MDSEQAKSFVDRLAEPKNGFLGIELLGNNLAQYAFALLVMLGSYVILRGITWLIIWQLNKIYKRTENETYAAIGKIVRSMHWGFYLYLSVYIAFLLLSTAEWITAFLQSGLIVVVTLQLSVLTVRIVDFGLSKLILREDSREEKMLLASLKLLSKIVIWSTAFLLALSNLGVNIAAFVAAAGIGGIALAFGLQSILADLFSSLAIYLDQPFAEGDFVIIGTDMGTVKNVGLKSTRIQALQGEELVVSNQELTSVRVQNFKKMHERRVNFTIGVVYETPLDKLKKIPGMIEGIINKTDNLRFDRAHFKEYADWSQNFEIVYFVESPDMVEYLDANQKVLFNIRAAFDKEEIVIAFPTSTVHIESMPTGQTSVNKQ